MPRRIVQVRVNLPQGFRHLGHHNNADNRYALARNQLYRIAFLRFTLIYARVFSEAQRKAFEFVILLMALFSFISLIYIHIVFVQSPITCLEGYLKEWESAKILRVELMHKNGNTNYSLYDSYYKEHAARLLEAGVKPCPRVQRLQTDENDTDKIENAEELLYKEEALDLADLLRCRLNETNERKSIFGNIAEEINSVFNFQPNEEINIIEYSFEYGFLRLSPAMRKSLNLTVLFVVLDPGEDTCIGGMFHKFIFDKFLGYDELLISSVRYLAHKSDYNGFVRNVRREIEYIFVNDDGWLRSYVVAAIIMPLTTFSVSLLLRFAHQQIFVVCTNIFELVRLRHQRRYNGSPLLTVVFALFGMMAIITSFFNNSTLTLNIIFMVWLADFYDAICCRALMAKRHWYRFFLLYHYVFCAYNNRFNGLHWQLNLLTSWLFILHSMLFFFHHYELPYYVQSFVEFRDTHRLRRRDPPRIPRVSTNVSDSSQAEEPLLQEQQVDEGESNLENSSSQELLENESIHDRDSEGQVDENFYHEPSVIRRSGSPNLSVRLAQGISSDGLSSESSHAAVSVEDSPKVKSLPETIEKNSDCVPEEFQEESSLLLGMEKSSRAETSHTSRLENTECHSTDVLNPHQMTSRTVQNKHFGLDSEPCESSDSCSNTNSSVVRDNVCPIHEHESFSVGQSISATNDY